MKVEMYKALSAKGDKILATKRGWTFFYYEDELTAITIAYEKAIESKKHQYVIKYKDVFVVCDYADIWVYFDGDWNSVIYNTHEDLTQQGEIR